MRYRLRFCTFDILKSKLQFCKWSLVLWQIDIVSAVWSPHEGGGGLNFWHKFVGWKSVSKRHRFDFILAPEPVSVPQSLLWPPPVLVRCCEYWGRPCACSAAGSVTLLLSEFRKKGFVKEAAPMFYLKPQGQWWSATSFEASGFPPQCTKRWFIWNLSIWLCVLASPHIDYMAVGKKSGDKHSEENWYQELLWRQPL